MIMPSWDSVDNLTRSNSRLRTPGQLLNYNQLTLYVNKAIDKRAEKVSQIEFTLTRGDKQIEDHEIINILNRPNQIHTGRQFWKLYQKYKDITGRSFIYVSRNNKTGIFSPETTELHLLRPDLVEIERDEMGMPSGYRYRMGDKSMHRTFDPDEIIYSFNPDPLKPLEGESILMSGVRAMDTENDLFDYHTNVLKNGGRVEGVFTFKNSLTKAQMDELHEQYAHKYAEAKRAGRPMFLGGDATYERLSLDPAELAYLESKKVTLNDICLMTGVPPAVLAHTSQEKYDNADAAHNIFLRETVKPLLEDLSTVLDWRFVPEEYDLGFIDPTPEDVDQTIKRVTAANAVSAATTNEKREMLGLEPLTIPEADEVFVPFSVAPLNGATDPEPAPEAPTDKKKGYDHPLRDERTRRRYEKLMVRRYDRREAIMKRVVKDYFEKQKNRLIDHIEGVRTYRRKDLFGESFDMTLEIDIAKGSVLPLLRQFLEEAGQNAMEIIGSSETFVLASEIGNWLDERAATYAKLVTETTFDRLKREFEASLEAGEGRKDLIARIQETYGGFTEGRATTIARTEVHNATQRGTFAGYQQASVPIKIWVTVGDHDVRDAHQIDGQERQLTMPFDLNDGEKLMYPGDPSGSAANTVNCRCSI